MGNWEIIAGYPPARPREELDINFREATLYGKRDQNHWRSDQRRRRARHERGDPRGHPYRPVSRHESHGDLSRLQRPDQRRYQRDERPQCLRDHPPRRHHALHLSLIHICIGIINVARVFGSGAVKASERVDLVVELQPWDKTKNYSRTGLESETIELLGLEVPYTVVPVHPGRNLAVILETAAICNRQKKMGYNAAEELMLSLIHI